MKKLLFTLLLATTVPTYPRTSAPLDSLLAQFDDSISTCLDDATRLDEARALILQVMAMEGVEQSELYPVMLFHEGTYYLNTGDVARWKQNRQRMFQMLPFNDYPELSISVPQELGLICRREGQIDSALYYYDQALQEALRQGDKEWLAAISANVGVLHYNMTHYKEAEQYLQQGLEYVRQVDDPYTELCLLQTNGAVKVALNKLAEAEPLLQEAYQMATEAESPDWQLRCLTTMMPLYDKLSLPDSAQACQQRGDALLPLLPQQGITAIGYITARAGHYYDKGQWALAVSDLENVAANAAGGVKTADVFERMARCYAQLGHWHEAFCYMDSARIEADTLASERLTAQMAEFNARYQTMEKDLQIARLQTQRLWFTVVAVALLLSLLGLWLWWRAHRSRREADMRIATLEAERKRIAKELHDGLCNDLLALEMQAAAESRTLEPSHSRTHEPSHLRTPEPSPILSERLHALRLRARSLSHQLMPPEFSHLSLNQLLRFHFEGIAANTPIAAVYTVDPNDDNLWQMLPPKVSHEVYRIAQELTSNIVKGAIASHLSASLTQMAPGHYLLTIVDDGKPVPHATTQRPGLGEHTLKDRILSIGARTNSYEADGQNHFELEFSA